MVGKVWVRLRWQITDFMSQSDRSLLAPLGKPLVRQSARQFLNIMVRPTIEAGPHSDQLESQEVAEGRAPMPKTNRIMAALADPTVGDVVGNAVVRTAFADLQELRQHLLVNLFQV